MLSGVVVPVLTFGTIGEIIVFARMSQIKTELRRHSNAPTSTPAVESPDSKQVVGDRAARSLISPRQNTADIRISPLRTSRLEMKICGNKRI